MKDTQITCTGKVTPVPVCTPVWMEGRFDHDRIEHFRREAFTTGLSSYPHPRLMPDYWEYPTVSMGLGAMIAIRQARFNRYLRDRGLVA